MAEVKAVKIYMMLLLSSENSRRISIHQHSEAGRNRMNAGFSILNSVGDSHFSTARKHQTSKYITLILQRVTDNPCSGIFVPITFVIKGSITED